MENPLLKSSQSWGAFWRGPATTEFNIFGWNFAHVFYLLIPTKPCSGFFLFCLDLELLINLVSVRV